MMRSFPSRALGRWNQRRPGASRKHYLRKDPAEICEGHMHAHSCLLKWRPDCHIHIAEQETPQEAFPGYFTTLYFTILYLARGGTNRVFGKPCLCPCQNRGRFDENGENDEFAFYPLKTRASLLRPPKTPKMTKMAGVTQAKAWGLFFPDLLDILLFTVLYYSILK